MRFIFSYIYLLLYKTNLLLFKAGIKKTFQFKPYLVSVGNLTAGGAGKTPMIIYLSSLLSHFSIQHSIVSRGYKKNNSKTTIVSDKQNILTGVLEAGDEPFLLASCLKGVPVVVGNKKRAISLSHKTFKSPVTLLDDGFQSHSINKNLNILLVDLSIQAKDYRLLPLGYLREPLSRSKKADIIIFTKCNFMSNDSSWVRKAFFLSSGLPESVFFNSNFILTLKKYSYQSHSFVDFNKKIFVPCVAVSGIANSEIFKKSLGNFCEKSFQHIVFSDHQIYKKKQINIIQKTLIKNDSKTILTTLKDFYKLYKFFNGFSFFIIDVEHKIENEERFKSLLLKKIPAATSLI